MVATAEIATSPQRGPTPSARPLGPLLTVPRSVRALLLERLGSSYRAALSTGDLAAAARAARAMGEVFAATSPSALAANDFEPCSSAEPPAITRWTLLVGRAPDEAERAHILAAAHAAA